MKRPLVIMLAAWPAAAWAHGGAHLREVGPPEWTLDATIVVPLLISAGLYALGFARLWARSDAGRSDHIRHAMLFGAGWLVLAGSLCSPLHEAGERSFTLHMIEHELIMVAAAPLIAFSRPLAVMLWALPQGFRQGMAAGAYRAILGSPILSEPITATLLQAMVLIAWHAPPLFNRALGHEGWHVAQHLSFLVSALVFWWAMARWQEARGYALSAMCLFVTSLIGGLLGALMAFSASPWYAGYAALGMTPYGLTPVEDQQLAGLVMWIPGGMVHATAALLLLMRALRSRETSSVAALD
jgi:cytochrome c oxidase assembly factor CtaG